MQTPDPSPLVAHDVNLRQALTSGLATPPSLAVGTARAMAAPTASQLTDNLAEFINGIPAFGSPYVDYMIRYNGLVASAAMATSRDQVIAEVGLKTKHGETYYIGPQMSYFDAFYVDGVVRDVDDGTLMAERTYQSSITASISGGFPWWQKFQDLLLKNALHQAAPEIAYKPGNLSTDLDKLNAELFTSSNLAVFQQNTLKSGYSRTHGPVSELSAAPAQAHASLLAAMQTPLFVATLNEQMRQPDSDSPFICEWLLYNLWCLLAAIGIDYPTIDGDIKALQAAGLDIPNDVSATVWHSKTAFWLSPLTIGYTEMSGSCPNLTAGLQQETVVNGTITDNTLVPHGLAQSYLVWYQQYLGTKH
jgi:hypothetical protein